MGATEFAAYWGAFIATIVLLWDIVKWKRTGRPDLRVIAVANMRSMGNAAYSLDEKTYDSFSANAVLSRPGYRPKLKKKSGYSRSAGATQYGVLQNIVVDIEFEGRIARVNASKIGSIYFMGDYALDYCLEFWDYLSSFFQEEKA